MEGRRYKAVCDRQGRHPEDVRIVRMARLPHWVWVIEFQDRESRLAKQPCVKAEMVFDATSHDEAPSVAVVSTVSLTLDVGALQEADFEEPEPDEADAGARARPRWHGRGQRRWQPRVGRSR